jgi:hypothetical protein
MTRRWVLRIVGAATAYGVVVVVMVLAGMRPRPAVLAAAATAIAVAYWMAADVGSRVAPARWTVYHAEERQRGRDTRVDHLRWRLTARADDDMDVSTFAPLLIELLDDRVAAGHGIDRFASRDEFERIVGPELSAFVSAPPTDNRARNPHFLADILTRIESL